MGRPIGSSTWCSGRLERLRRTVALGQVVAPGDSHLLPGEQVERSLLLEENERIEADGKQPATYELLLLGITKASLLTESFISAASFQETTRVLTESGVDSNGRARITTVGPSTASKSYEMLPTPRDTIQRM